MSERSDRLRGIAEHAAQNGRVVITGHDHADTDSVISCVLMRALLSAWGVPADVALPAGADRQSRRVLAGFGVDVPAMEGPVREGDQLILVDHHRPLHGGQVAACIDHHPAVCPPAYPYVQIEPRGACALQALDLLHEAGVCVTAWQEALAVTALWLDTVALRSAKISAQEAAWGRTRAEELGLDLAQLEREGLGLADMRLAPELLAMQNKKTYDFDGVRVISTALQTDAMTQERLAALLDVIRRALPAQRAALWVFLVHDPLAMRTMEYDIYPDGRVRTIAYDCLASRGKNVMPRVEREIRDKKKEKAGVCNGVVSAGTDFGA